MEVPSNEKIDGLVGLALRGLTTMYDPGKRAFCYRMKKNDDGIQKEGLSRRYTIISLLGLHKLEAHGGRSPIDVQASLAALLESIHEIDNIGDLGLLLWLCSLVSPGQLDPILPHLDIKGVLRRYPDARQGKTTELSWFLAGLSHIALALGQKAEGLEDLSNQTYKTLEENYGGRGIFGHLKKSTLAGVIRGRIGCFADQVYPIYALTKFAQAYGNQEALKVAVECGKTICFLQGPLGQWWWHYDSVKGRVLGQYPVYAVHQDGMGPMALFTLSKSTGLDFDTYIYKGLEWITGKNELGFNLVDTTHHLIWRNFYRKKYKMYYDEIVALTHFDPNKEECKDLIVLFECRPYHLGWLLYAFVNHHQDDRRSKKSS